LAISDEDEHLAEALNRPASVRIAEDYDATEPIDADVAHEMREDARSIVTYVGQQLNA
jgi:hypothetical protein